MEEETNRPSKHIVGSVPNTKGRGQKKNEAFTPRSRCFHNGIILIVSCFQFVRQI